MDTRNFDYLTAETQRNLNYHLGVKPTATTVPEWKAEVLEIFDTALKAFSDVLRCTEVKLSIQPMRTDRALSGDGEYPYDYQATTAVTVQSEDGISIADMETAIESATVAPDQTLVPLALEMSETQTRVYLNQGFLLVDQDCQYYWKRQKSQVIEETPEYPPMKLSISHKKDPPDYDTHYKIKVTTTSDIWTLAAIDERVDTLVQINRARLAEAVSNLKSSLELLYADWTSVDFGGQREYFNKVIDNDGPSSEELIYQYRVNWVKSTLLDQATGTVVDGERVVDFGQIPELVFPEELRARIETYVQATDSTETVDCIRVTTDEGIQLQGAVTDDGIDWDIG